MRERVGVTEIANFAKYAIYRAGRRGLPVAGDDEPHAQGRANRADPDAEREGQAHRRLHHRQSPPGRMVTTDSSCGDRARRRFITCAGSSGTFPKTSRSRSGRSAWTSSGFRSPGPRARDVLAKLTDDDVSSAAFRFLDFRETHLASVPVMVNRVTYTGDLGYEIWVAPGISAAALREGHGGGRGIRHREFRHARPALAAPGEELADLVPRAPARSTGRSRRMSAASST